MNGRACFRRVESLLDSPQMAEFRILANSIKFTFNYVLDVLLFKTLYKPMRTKELNRNIGNCVGTHFNNHNPMG